MKRFLSIFILSAILCSSYRADAQTITSHSITGICLAMDSIVVGVTGCTSGLAVKTYYGDGSTDSDIVTCSGSFGFSYPTHTYAAKAITR